ncbi:ATP-binding protein [Thiothrix lacustris]|uniref:ATP-binding protein n=1 Tax=Thiothrix lacustris TaxID=525917 RepID=A0ABY9MRJ9_9GAMM|nr:ATP-binding protein [Thiothrix lacustris]WML91283.1 ATP-binding protein [Thiothrix lacustris]
MTERKRLPIGIQTFREIREDNHYYVDKTGLIQQIVESGKHYFLSRPRRFGKSLLLDTLKELFEGNEPLFQGLAIHDQWDWSVQSPVLRFSFGRKNYRQPQALAESLHQQLTQFEENFQLERRFEDAGSRFADLIEKVKVQTGLPVVVLIDEYDKPILDALEYPDIAKANRDFLRGFYGTIKDFDGHIRFSFLTGVSKFSKVSLFSGLNNLEDITLIPRYSSLCGYTDEDIDTVFAPELPGLDRAEIRAWYNGYNWLGTGVYNPFDILQLFKNHLFRNYWFETGTPTFLVEQLLKRQIPTLTLDSMLSSSDMLSSFEVGNITTEALLFQTGYLTIKQEENLGGQYFYTLGYPNREVYQSLNETLLSALVLDKSKQVVHSNQLYRLLLNNDFAGLKQLFHSFFASIPHQWYNNNEIQHYEGYYASVFYSYFASLGLNVTLEDTSNLGRIDMTLKFNQQVYIFEFKVVELIPQGKALQQIKDRAYADKYRGLNQPIYLIGVEFSKTDRNIVGFEWEQG